MKIFVKTLTSKTLTLEVEPSITIQQLKMIVNVKEGIPVCQQGFIFNGRRLKAGLSLIAQNVKAESRLDLVFSSASEEILISVMASYGNGTIPVRVKRGDTVKTIKDQIQEKVGLTPKRQVILFKRQKLHDSQTLIDSGIDNGDKLEVAMAFFGEREPERDRNN